MLGVSRTLPVKQSRKQVKRHRLDLFFRLADRLIKSMKQGVIGGMALVAYDKSSSGFVCLE
jgi:hypothetical protein